MVARKKKGVVVQEENQPKCSQAVWDGPRGDVKAARPTEYKGVVYRSKSEAMFARYLELTLADWCVSREGGLKGVAGFHYEPAYLDLDGWRPDFLVFRTSLPCSITLEARRTHFGKRYSAPSTWCEIIEYKPSRPTDTYIQEFQKRCESLLDNAWGEDFQHGTGMIIFYGSVFNKERSIIEFDGFDFKDRETDWLEGYEVEVAKTRFDLRAF